MIKNALTLPRGDLFYWMLETTKDQRDWHFAVKELERKTKAEILAEKRDQKEDIDEKQYEFSSK